MIENQSLLQLHLQRTDSVNPQNEPVYNPEVPTNVIQFDEREELKPGTSNFQTEGNDSLLFEALMTQENTEPQTPSNGELSTPKSEKPNWFPSRSSRSIVWDHISWIESSQRAACNYCSAEFQIKGGTSAVLRHLKTIHPQNIDFDPTLEPVRKRKKKTDDNSFSINNDNIMHELLKSMFPNGEMGAVDLDTEQGESSEDQSRVDLELNEVIRNLGQETSSNLNPTSTIEVVNTANPDADRDLRKILGILDDQPVVEDIGVGASSSSQPVVNNGNKSNSNTNGNSNSNNKQNGKFGKFSLSLLSSLKKSGDQSPHQQPMLGNSQNGGKLEQESRVLYNQSLHSTIVRENAMTNYYNLKSRYLQLSIQKLEKELQQ